MESQIINKRLSPALALSILTSRVGEPIGVIIPVIDWDKLEPDLNPDSPLYKLLKKLASISIDRQEALKEPEKIKTDTYVRYKNDLCMEENVFIHEYIDHKELIRLNPKTGYFEFLERLN